MSTLINHATSKDWNRNVDLIFITPQFGENKFVTVSGPFVLSSVSLPGNQAWFWASEWQAGEAEADADLREGRYRTFENMEDFINFLDSDEDE